MWIVVLFFAFIPSVLSCGETFTLNEEGGTVTFTSPTYPPSYPDQTNCTWIINAPTASEMTLYCNVHIKNTGIRPNKNYLSYFYGDKQFGVLDNGVLDKTIPTTSMGVRFYSNLKRNGKYKGIKCKVSFKTDTTFPSSSDPSGEPSTGEPSTGEPSTGEPSTGEPSTGQPSSENCHCGLKNVIRIVGGKETTENEYPWQVMLMSTTNPPSHFCGGSLISTDFVVTASHCVEGRNENDIQVLLGEHDKTVNETQSKFEQISQIIIHESYSDITLDNDIALLKLANSVTFTYAIAPVCLPFNYVTLNLSGEIGTVTGWGTLQSGGSVSDILMEVDIPLLTTKECQSSDYDYGSIVTNNMICAYEVGKDSCQGDSGGPLVWTDHENYFLLGIVSWGYGCAGERTPGVYTKVTNYLDWIVAKTATEFCLP